MKTTYKDTVNQYPEYTFTKLGKGYSVKKGNGTLYRCGNLKELISRCEALSRSEQGADAISIDATKIVAFAVSVNSPIPSAVINKKKTAEISRNGETPLKAVNQLLTEQTFNRSGKPVWRVYPELQEVVTIRNKLSSELKKLCLDWEHRGSQVVSVHHLAKAKSLVADCNDQLKKQSEIIKGRLEDWRKKAESRQDLDLSKFPDENYFSGYGAYYQAYGFPESNIPNQEASILEKAIEKIGEQVQAFVVAIGNYINGTSTKFTENTVNNLIETAQNLKQSEIINGSAFDNLVDKVLEVGKACQPDKIRKAKETLEKGVVDPSNKVGKGRRPNPVTESDIAAAEDVLEDAQKSFSELDELVSSI